jgi:hypothetical protein
MPPNKMACTTLSIPSVENTPALGIAEPGKHSKKMVKAVQAKGMIFQVQNFLTRRIMAWKIGQK